MHILLFILLFITNLDFTHSWKSRFLSSFVSTTQKTRQRIVVGTTCLILALSPPINLLHPPPTLARNLPQSNGASAINRGQPSSLVPILKIKQIVEQASQQTDDLIACAQLLHQIPSKEGEFKKLFDEHSEGISYKQVFMDQNGFLVYYTQGFDGPGRPTIEQDDDSTIREKAQFGARNDAWVSVDEALSEAEYLLSNPTDTDRSDLRKSLRLVSQALTEYVSLDSAEVVREATNLLR